MEKGPIAILIIALAVLAAGVVRIVHLGHFGITQAVYCAISIPVSLVLLMIADYTLHHARVVLVMVVAMVGLWCVMSPNFCVGMGLALGGMVLTQLRG